MTEKRYWIATFDASSGGKDDYRLARDVVVFADITRAQRDRIVALVELGEAAKYEVGYESGEMPGPAWNLDQFSARYDVKTGAAKEAG